MKLKKLKMLEVHSDFEKLSKESLALIIGGSGYTNGGTSNSCTHSGSSCGCVSIAVCNCPPPVIIPKG